VVRYLWELVHISVIVFTLGEPTKSPSTDILPATQKMIKDYDKGNLSLKQEEQFIQHILNCEDCKEELEIYYIVSYGLDEDNISKNTPPAIKACIDSYDFKT
jgi:hypothetical protein